jgi:tricorn protease-like protein
MKFCRSENFLLVGRTDINHATDIFSVNLKNGEMKQVTEANKEIMLNWLRENLN